MNKNNDYMVQCPYYCKDQSRSIYCEGLTETSNLNISFANRAALTGHKNRFCRSVWASCPVAAVQNQRYQYTP